MRQKFALALAVIITLVVVIAAVWFAILQSGALQGR